MIPAQISPLQRSYSAPVIFSLCLSAQSQVHPFCMCAGWKSAYKLWCRLAAGVCSLATAETLVEQWLDLQTKSSLICSKRHPLSPVIKIIQRRQKCALRDLSLCNASCPPLSFLEPLSPSHLRIRCVIWFSLSVCLFVPTHTGTRNISLYLFYYICIDKKILFSIQRDWSSASTENFAPYRRMQHPFWVMLPPILISFLLFHPFHVCSDVCCMCV